MKNVAQNTKCPICRVGLPNAVDKWKSRTIQTAREQISALREEHISSAVTRDVANGSQHTLNFSGNLTISGNFCGKLNIII